MLSFPLSLTLPSFARFAEANFTNFTDTGNMTVEAVLMSAEGDPIAAEELESSSEDMEDEDSGVKDDD